MVPCRRTSNCERGDFGWRQVCGVQRTSECGGGDESVLAAVMAHEIGHALYRHPVSLMARAVLQRHLLDSLSRARTKGTIIASAATTAAYQVLSQKLSRDEESQADQIGLLILADAGYAPDFAFIMHQQLRQSFGDASKFAAFFSDHPRWVTRTERTFRVCLRLEKACSFY
jgi:beta-barrel assembly-enhancing protease